MKTEVPKGTVGSNPTTSAKSWRKTLPQTGVSGWPIEGVTNLQINQYSLRKMFTMAIVETIHGVRPRNGLHNFWLVSIVWPIALPCHGRGHRFKSGTGRQIYPCGEMDYHKTLRRFSSRFESLQGYQIWRVGRVADRKSLLNSRLG